MPDVRTSIKITADDSSARKLGVTLGKAFDKRGARELATTAKALESQFLSTTKTVARLTQELVKTKQGTEAFKALSKELKNAADQAGMLGRALTQIENIQHRQDRDNRRRANEGRRSFFGGLMQGTGMAQYMPAEPGMRSRAAGVLMGGAMRRGLGGAAAPFLLPGMGGLSQMAGAVPVIGQALSGALSTAAGAYQTAVGFDRARWQALSFMGPSGGNRYRMGPGVEASEDFNKARTADKAAQEQFLAAQQAQNQAERNEKIARDHHFRAKTRQDRAYLRTQQALSNMQKLSPAPGGFAQAAGLGAPSYAATVEAPARRWTEAAKERTKEARLAAEDAARELSNARERSSKPRFGVAAGLPGAGAGIEFGLGPTQMMGMFTEFMRSRGGVYDQAGERQFREAMAASARAGISTTQAGAFNRMGLAGGGGAMGKLGLSEVLQAAFAEGLNGSQVAEYLQTLVQIGQQAERTGVKMDVQAFTRSSALLSRAGFEGLQAQRVTGGMQQAGMRLSAQGVSGPMDVLMARAAGFDPSQGPEGYARAMNKLAGGMTPDMLNNLLGTLTTGVQGSDFGPEMQALMMRRAMAKMGVQVGPGQASILLDSYKKSGGKLPSGVEELWSKGEEGGARDALLQEARRRVSVGAGLTRGAAGLEATQIGLGRGAAGFVVGAEMNQLKFSLSIVKNFGGGLEKLNGVVLRAIKGFDKLIETMEIGAGFSSLVGVLGSPVKKPGAPTPSGKRGGGKGRPQ